MNYRDIKEMLCDKLQEVSMVSNPSMTDVEKMHVLTDTIKNIGKIEMQDGGHSQRMYPQSSNGRGYYQGTYENDNGNSYGRHYVRGHYSRAMTDEMEQMMNEPGMSSQDKETLRRAMALMR